MDFPRCSRLFESMISSYEQTISPPRFASDFKDEAVRQITERGYSVAGVSVRLGISAYLDCAALALRGQHSHGCVTAVTRTRWACHFLFKNRPTVPTVLGEALASLLVCTSID